MIWRCVGKYIVFFAHDYFLSDLYVKPARSHAIVKQTRWVPKASWACAVLVLRFSNYNVLACIGMRTISERTYSGEGNWKAKRQLLMFGSRHRCTKSGKERNYAPRLANSWLRNWRQLLRILFIEVAIFLFYQRNHSFPPLVVRVLYWNSWVHP